LADGLYPRSAGGAYTAIHSLAQFLREKSRKEKKEGRKKIRKKSRRMRMKGR